MLHAQWQSCTECRLGTRRIEAGMPYIAGEGHLNGLMVIDRSPTATDEETGKAFSGEAGRFIRGYISEIGIKEVYYTSLVACRSCDIRQDAEGKPFMRFDRRLNANVVVIQDEAPKPAEIKACRDRLMEEIYLVDPLLILSLGGTVTEALTGRKGKQSTDLHYIDVPGAAQVPALTEKGAWVRRVRGSTVWPTRQFQVKYPVFPLQHPAYVMQRMPDKRMGAPMKEFVKLMQRVRELYNMLNLEIHGVYSDAT